MIEPDPRIDPADLRNARFPGSFRRYDGKAVEEFLESVAERVAATNELVDQLRRELDAARTVRTADVADGPNPFDGPDLANVGEDDLVRLVGEETAHVLATARKAAADIRTKAEESAARVIREATAEASRVVEEAETRATELTAEAAGARDAAVAEAESVAALIRDGATEDAEHMLANARTELEEAQETAREQVEAARAEAEGILEAAREEGRSMVNEAKEVRTRVLEDLQRRRDLGRAQLERLVEGREQILAAYAAVRANVDEVTAQLEGELLHSSDPADDEGFVGVVSTTAEEPEPELDEPEPEPEPDEPEAEPVAEEPEAPEEPEAEVTDPDPEPAVAEVEPEPEPEPVATDEAGAAVDEDVDEDEDAVAEPESADVDALFARIRSEREESVARAQKVLAGGDAEEPAPAAEAAPEPEVAEADDVAEPGSDGVDRVDPALLADDDALAARQEALEPLDRKLSRALKRHLADEQNEVLDALRRTESTEVASLLPAADDHVGGYAAVAAKVLVTAAAAGVDVVGGSGAVDVESLARSVGETIVEPFRRRIERSAADVDGDADALDERLRALYREWKVEHIGPAATDALLTAYALGQHAGAPDDARVSWRIDPAQGPCPDAQDNALAGAIPKAETFPTGDRCPQAHPGCRCLLVVES